MKKVIIFLMIVNVMMFSFWVISAQDDDTQAKIDNAMLAGPSAISEEATVLDYVLDDNGDFVVLRQGDNGWYCFPDFPSSPSDDPMCLDDMWVSWLAALFVGAEPEITELGLSYMLLGGSGASNDDPFQEEPLEGEVWLYGPPHVMILLPGGYETTGLPTSPNDGGPWVMWAGTPYEHIMMPIAAMLE